MNIRRVSQDLDGPEHERYDIDGGTGADIAVHLDSDPEPTPVNLVVLPGDADADPTTRDGQDLVILYLPYIDDSGLRISLDCYEGHALEAWLEQALDQVRQL